MSDLIEDKVIDSSGLGLDPGRESRRVRRNGFNIKRSEVNLRKGSSEGVTGLGRRQFSDVVTLPVFIRGIVLQKISERRKIKGEERRK